MPWLVILLHEPPYSAGVYGPAPGDPIPRLTGAYYLIPPIAEKFGVDLVLSGHDHNYQRSYPLSHDVLVGGWEDPEYSSPRGCVYLISGGGGTRLYSERPGATFRPLMKVFAEVHHAVELQFSETKLEVMALTPAREMLDHFTIRKDAGPFKPGFRRGDADFDDRVNLTDAVVMLHFLFLGAGTPCPNAFKTVGDPNGSGDINIADPIYLLNHLFLGGPPPGPPYESCEELAGFEDAMCVAASCRV